MKEKCKEMNYLAIYFFLDERIKIWSDFFFSVQSETRVWREIISTYLILKRKERKKKHFDVKKDLGKVDRKIVDQIGG